MGKVLKRHTASEIGPENFTFTAAIGENIKILTWYKHADESGIDFIKIRVQGGSMRKDYVKKKVVG